MVWYGRGQGQSVGTVINWSTITWSTSKITTLLTTLWRIIDIAFFVTPAIKIVHHNSFFVHTSSITCSTGTSQFPIATDALGPHHPSNRLSHPKKHPHYINMPYLLTQNITLTPNCECRDADATVTITVDRSHFTAKIDHAATVNETYLLPFVLIIFLAPCIIFFTECSSVTLNVPESCVKNCHPHRMLIDRNDDRVKMCKSVHTLPNIRTTFVTLCPGTTGAEVWWRCRWRSSLTLAWSIVCCLSIWSSNKRINSQGGVFLHRFPLFRLQRECNETAHRIIKMLLFQE